MKRLVVTPYLNIKAWQPARAAGQSIVLVALAIVVLVAMAGLGLDGANAFNQRRNTANAADAAAMAGSNALIQQLQAQVASGTPMPSAPVYSAVSTYLNAHEIDPTAAKNPWTAYYVDSSGTRMGAVSSGGTINASAKGVAVDVQYTFDTWFMGVFGRETLTVGGTATAIFGKKKFDTGDLLPIALSEDAANDMKDDTGDVYVFNGDSGNAIGPGNFGSISLHPGVDSPNATGNMSQCTNPTPAHDTASYWWCNGTTYDVHADQWLYSDPGEPTGAKSAVDWRIGNNPIGLVPIYDDCKSDKSGDPLLTKEEQCNGNNAQFHIIGFMVVQLTGESLTGNPKTISAKYLSYAASTGAIDPNSPVDGLYAINLIK